jgi:hypothetical protein
MRGFSSRHDQSAPAIVTRFKSKDWDARAAALVVEQFKKPFCRSISAGTSAPKSMLPYRGARLAHHNFECLKKIGLQSTDALPYDSQ